MGGRMMPGLSLDEILAILPHRYPFLLVDRIIEVEERRVVGIKNVTINEPFFPGHIPGFPVMPGVLVVEAMAQVGACLLLNAPQLRGRLAYLAGIDRCRFRRPVVPGDTLRIDVELRALRGRLGKIWGVARVGDEVAAEAEITFALPEAGWAGALGLLAGEGRLPEVLARAVRAQGRTLVCVQMVGENPALERLADVFARLAPERWDQLLNLWREHQVREVLV